MKYEGKVRRCFYFNTHEVRAVEEYLEEMARKGLFIVAITGNVFEFKKDKSRNYKYAVTYNRDQQYEDCGWHRIICQKGIQVYYSEEESPMPIQMDEEMLLKQINKSVLFSGALWYLLLSVANIFFMHSLIKNSFSGFITSNMKMATQGACLLAYGMWMGYLIKYAGFYIRNRRRLKAGKPLKFATYKTVARGNRRVRTVYLIIILLFLLGLLNDEAGIFGGIEKASAGVLLAAVVIYEMKNDLSMQKHGRKAVFAGATALVLAEAGVACMIGADIKMRLEHPMETSVIDTSSSLLASCEKYDIDEESVGEGIYSYEVLRSRFPWILESAAKNARTKYDRDSRALPAESLKRCGAKAGYEVTYNDTLLEVILLYEDRILTFSIDAEGVDEVVGQIAEIANSL